jgi:quercetin dioxygenase-like cupin family protein
VSPPSTNSHVLYTSLFLVALAVTSSPGRAQQVTFKHTELQRGDLSISGREAVQTLAEIPRGVASGRHTHPGEEVGYILEGTVVMEVEGKPPVTLKAGNVFLIPAGRIHNAETERLVEPLTGPTEARAGRA